MITSCALLAALPAPNDLNGNEDCLMLNGDWNHWNDNVCGYPFAFSCERY